MRVTGEITFEVFGHRIRGTSELDAVVTRDYTKASNHFPGIHVVEVVCMLLHRQLIFPFTWSTIKA